MKQLYEIENLQLIKFHTYVFVQHKNCDKKFLFKVPDGLNVNRGDTVLCDTIYGEALGTVVSEPIELSFKALKALSTVMDFYPEKVARRLSPL